MSPNVGKAVGDIEMGRKPVTWDELRAVTQVGENEEGLSSRNMMDDKDGEFSEDSPDLSREAFTTGMEVQPTLHHRRLSWGRGGSWGTSPDFQAVAFAAREMSRTGSGNGSSGSGAGNL